MKKLLKTLLCSLMILANVTMISAESTTTELDAIIAQVEQLNEEEYSMESFRALEQAMQDAKQLDENASQETIDAAKANPRNNSDVTCDVLPNLDNDELVK